MLIVQIVDGLIHWITPWTDWQEVPEFPPSVVLMEAPLGVEEGWAYNADGTFSPHVPVEKLPEVTLLDIAQIVSELEAKLIVAGVIPPADEPETPEIIEEDGGDE